ncbi:MAG: PRC-barrel domain-containing protein [Hormoscilla sp. SP5CHS1]|nr:PRC-barrel domain-containing protein [Hormoscilla sp. SP12CHS1]MBC6452439.1 PRC-barrel domain-containing protein [Hormoscilla sp. SP5CHS1]
MMPEQIIQRSEFLGTQVITRDTGKRLGVVSQLWVDIDRQEVVAVSLRENPIAGLLSSIPRYMYLSSIRQIGDVILVDDDNVIKDIDVEAYSSLINSEVITEAGEMLGRVRGFKFSDNDYKVCALIIASLGIPQIPDQVVSTYELPIDQIVSSGPNRLIVFEGAEEQLIQLSVGWLERLGIGEAPWEREGEEAYMIPTIQTDKQLGPGTPARTAKPIRQTAPVVEETWNEDNWQQPDFSGTVPEPMHKLQPELAYEELEQDNWGLDVSGERYSHYSGDIEATSGEQYGKKAYASPESKGYYEEDYSDMSKDAWADDEPEAYKPPRVNIPEKAKKPEYEGEMDY